MILKRLILIAFLALSFGVAFGQHSDSLAVAQTVPVVQKDKPTKKSVKQVPKVGQKKKAQKVKQVSKKQAFLQKQKLRQKFRRDMRNARRR